MSETRKLIQFLDKKISKWHKDTELDIPQNPDDWSKVEFTRKDIAMLTEIKEKLIDYARDSDMMKEYLDGKVKTGYTEEQIDCLLAEIEDKISAGKYGGDNENSYEMDVHVRDEIMEIVRETKAEKDLIIKRKLK